jgi:hypothetical protein
MSWDLDSHGPEPTLWRRDSPSALGPAGGAGGRGGGGGGKSVAGSATPTGSARRDGCLHKKGRGKARQAASVGAVDQLAVTRSPRLFCLRP